jgi:hypothetical protein
VRSLTKFVFVSETKGICRKICYRQFLSGNVLIDLKHRKPTKSYVRKWSPFTSWFFLNDAKNFTLHSRWSSSFHIHSFYCTWSKFLTISLVLFTFFLIFFLFLCERTTDYRSRISCLNLTSLFALFVFLLCRRAFTIDSSTPTLTRLSDKIHKFAVS